MIQVTIPNSLKEINLKQYKKFLVLSEKAEDDESSQRFLQSKMIEIFCNIPLNDVLKLKLQDCDEISSIIYKRFGEKPKLITRFELNKIDYGFHSKLDDMSLGEYIDLDLNIGDWKSIEKAMAVLYRPVVSKLKDKYNIAEYKVGNEAAMLEMPMDAVMSSIFFFWNLGLELSTIMTNSLDKGETQALTQFLTSQPSGVGINQFTDSLKEMLHDLKILQN